MKGLARISFRDGALLLPARSPYERELLFEHIDLSVKRHGRVGLELDRREWRVSSCDREHPRRCACCHGEYSGLVFSLGWQTLCGRCGKDQVVSATGSRLPAWFRVNRPAASNKSRPLDTPAPPSSLDEPFVARHPRTGHA